MAVSFGAGGAKLLKANHLAFFGPVYSTRTETASTHAICVMTVHLPEGFRLDKAEVGGETVELANQAETATVRILPSATKTVAWKMAFAKR